MASRARRGGALAREDEPRRDERAEQQAPAPQGPVLPPPPPVDYGVFMQGLVQAMQTQAHTQVALQAQLEAQELKALVDRRDNCAKGLDKWPAQDDAEAWVYVQDVEVHLSNGRTQPDSQSDDPLWQRTGVVVGRNSNGRGSE
ncbi:hypothetical protein Taro_037675 [Colocasia esculenta]|uniref:Uncharacterized protein n=1 Tax=Colocasia esculenta TaxID=4460 RepID=A0A843WBQ2_COLES|nr:hypothetical protein [Colocasia esculenta]